MNKEIPTQGHNQPFKVADIGLAAEGRLDISLAEAEMPALMQIREQYREAAPLKGAKIAGSLHMTVQTAVLIETLQALGAEVKWSSCNPYSTQDHAAAAVAVKGTSIYAWKGETDAEYDWCLRQTLVSDDGWVPNLILDDGADLSIVAHEEYASLLDGVHGISEETTTGVRRLRAMAENGDLKVPVIDVNASVTKCKNDNRYGCRHSLNDAIKRGTDILISGKRALVIGYGEVGKGSAASLRQEGAIVTICEVDPICAMQAALDGYLVDSPYVDGDPKAGVNSSLLRHMDFVITATGGCGVMTSAMVQALKAGCVLANIGHFDTEIEVAQLRDACRWEQIKPHVHRLWRDDGSWVILLAEGRLVNLANATGHPSRVMDGSFANQVLAQIQLYTDGFARLPTQSRAEQVIVTPMPRSLDEEVARAMVRGFGGTMTHMTQEQADYLGIDVAGPYKRSDYMY